MQFHYSNNEIKLGYVDLTFVGIVCSFIKDKKKVVEEFTSIVRFKYVVPICDITTCT